MGEIDARLREGLPQPPPPQPLATSGVWIVEWRGEDESRGGTALRQWLEARYPGWSRLVACRGRTDAISAIKAAAWFARDAKASPILHLDVHCDSEGLQGPGRDVEPTGQLSRREQAGSFVGHGVHPMWRSGDSAASRR